MKEFNDVKQLIKNIELSKYRLNKLDSLIQSNDINYLQNKYYLIITTEEMIEILKNMYSLAYNEEKIKLELLMNEFKSIIK